MKTIDWDQLALSAAERDLAGIVREIAARYAQQGQSITEAMSPPAALATERSGRSSAPDELSETAPALTLDWRTLVAIADEAEADIGLHARHEPWVLARLLRLPGDEALRRDGALLPLDAPVDLHWPDAPAPAVFRAIAAAFADDDLQDDNAASFAAKPSALPMAARPHGSNGPACST
ncbi:hypothetical protein PHO31112_04438 [Pandoraea horticolens]|uniref:Uncharacterized protein n=1 Tax=Pandoraea horticolens TaxID=2508298 RepID=A0A5E4YDJ3_9BURK|nr:DUF2471 family protein [Pandoraea horticolens]VVE46530.1 hypothetical protein PHO31112_04438 [Pandoraea horticolens]